MNINKLIEMAIEKGASDVHLNVGIEPISVLTESLKESMSYLLSQKRRLLIY